MVAAVDTVVFWLFLLYAALIACDLLLQGRGSGRGLRLVIPNWLPLVVVIALIVKLVALQAPTGVIFGHIAVGFGMLMLAFLLFTKGMLGGGLAKLAPAVLAYLGPAYLLSTVSLFLVIVGLGAIGGIVLKRLAAARFGC